MEYVYDNTIFGDVETIDSIVKDILQDTEKLMDEDLQFDIRLILNELLINCHKHGNKSDCDKAIYLKFILDSKQVSILVQDEGQGVSGHRPYDVNSLLPNGRGLILVEALVDDIKYDHNMIKCKILRTS